MMWEQQYWLDFLAVPDRASYRKTQVRRGYLEKTVSAWGLMDIDFVHGRAEGDSLRQTCLSSACLLAWLFDCHRQHEKAHSDKLSKFGHLVSEIIDISTHGTQHLDGAPSMIACGVEMPVNADMRVPLHGVLRSYVDLPREWEDVRTSANTCGLRPWPASGCPSLGDLLIFLEARVFYSGHLPIGHPMVMWRNVALQITTTLFELAVHHHLAQDPRQRSLEPTTLYGPTGMRRARRGYVTKSRWLHRMRVQYGSDNAIMKALADGHCGYTSTVRHIANRLYSEDTVVTFKDCNTVAFNWDEASYSGWSVNVSMATDVTLQRARYLFPKVGQI